MPFLLSLAHIDRYEIFYDNTVDLLQHYLSGFIEEATLLEGHLYLTWSNKLQ